jgi:hypothetical protein
VHSFSHPREDGEEMQLCFDPQISGGSILCQLSETVAEPDRTEQPENKKRLHRIFFKKVEKVFSILFLFFGIFLSLIERKNRKTQTFLRE